jgi:MFS family permease
MPDRFDATRPSSAEPSSTYRDLIKIPNWGRIVASLLLARTASQMYALVLVLFVLGRFHSPQLAGLAVMGSVAPGLVLSPLAGALLDRGARVPLVVTDYVVGAAATTLLSVLALTGRLPVAALLAIVIAGSLTQPLSNTGLRSAIPLMVPRGLWDRANAVDSGTYLVATVVGPGVGGAAVALIGPNRALLVPAAALGAAALILLRVSVPRTAAPTTPILRDAWAGLVYVCRNRDLRMLALTISTLNIGGGAITVALPVLVIRRLHGGSATTGAMFAVMGVAGVLSGVVFGHLGTEGRERVLMTAGAVVSSLAFVVLGLGGTFLAVAAAMTLLGLATGPLDLGLFSLRQRATDPAWFGRAFAVSMSLNYIGLPLGAALAGPVAARSTTAAFLLAAGLTVLAAAMPYSDGLIRRRAARSHQVSGA